MALVYVVGVHNVYWYKIFLVSPSSGIRLEGPIVLRDAHIADGRLRPHTFISRLTPFLIHYYDDNIHTYHGPVSLDAAHYTSI